MAIACSTGERVVASVEELALIEVTALAADGVSSQGVGRAAVFDPAHQSQRPELLPQQAELHLRSDRAAIAYRRWLRQLGLTFGTA
jgi:hypothetical protein